MSYDFQKITELPVVSELDDSAYYVVENDGHLVRSPLQSGGTGGFVIDPDEDYVNLANKIAEIAMNGGSISVITHNGDNTIAVMNVMDVVIEAGSNEAGGNVAYYATAIYAMDPSGTMIDFDVFDSYIAPSGQSGSESDSGDGGK